MPHKLYKYTYDCNGCVCWRTVAVCECCSQQGQYDGWSKGMYEAMSARHTRTGLTALSKYQWVFQDAFHHCDDCAGRGLLDVNAGETFRDCPRCEGSGLERICSTEALRRLRQLAGHLVWIDSLMHKRPGSLASALN